MSIYRPHTGPIILPKWAPNRTIALAEYHRDSRRVEIAWRSGPDAVDILSAGADLLFEGDNTVPLMNRKYEICGFAAPGPTELRAIPVATPYKKELADKHRSFTMSDWRLGADALIQAMSIDERGETVCVDDVSGADAWSKLMQLACDTRAKLVGDPDAVYGLAWPDGTRVEMWDCDEMTYGDYLQCLAEVMQDYEEHGGGN